MFPGSVSGRWFSAGDDGRHGARERHSNLIRLVSPVRRDGRRHGQTDFVFASRPATAGRLAFDFAAGMTARGCERSGEVVTGEISDSPFLRDSRLLLLPIVRVLDSLPENVLINVPFLALLNPVQPSSD